MIKAKYDGQIVLIDSKQSITIKGKEKLLFIHSNGKWVQLEK